MGLQIDMFTGELSLPPPSEDLDQWFTRPKVARAFADFAGITPGMRVLEPSAGEGALLKSAPQANWTAVELCSARSQWIRKHGWAAEVFHEDFLRFAPELGRRGMFIGPDHRIRGERPFDLVHQNPPYTDGLDTDFVEACVQNQLAPRITGLLVTNFLHTANRQTRIWRYVKLTRVAILATRPQFGQANGKSEGPKRDYSFFEMMVRKTPRRDGAGDRPLVTWVNV